MKKIILLCLLFLGSQKLLLSQKFITTTAAGGNGWQSSGDNINWSSTMYAGAPESWQTAAAGTGLTGIIGTMHNPPASNFIWARPQPPSGPSTPSTTYYRFIFNRNTYPCKKVTVHVCSDDASTVSVNGQAIGYVTNDPSYKVYTFDITDKIKCGVNSINVEVASNGVFEHFLGVVEFGSPMTTDKPNITTDVIQCGKPLVLHAPKFLGSADNTYEWTGPNGFTSNLKDPSIQYPSARNSGEYKVKVTSACCTKEFTLDVNVDNCDKCIVNVNYTKTGCNEYTITAQSDFVNVNCFQWQLNGKNITGSKESTVVTLSPGKHKICYKFFGNQLSNVDQWCCDEVCTDEIEVLEPTSDLINLEVCRFGTEEPCAPYNLRINETFSQGGWTSADINDQGQMSYLADYEVCLREGTNTIKYYDQFMCLIHTRTINVTVKVGSTTECETTVYVCQPILPESVMPPCVGCYNPTNPNVTASNPELISVGISLPPNIQPNSLTYQRTFTDKDNCRRCIFTYTLVSESCNFEMPNIQWQYFNQFPVFSFNFPNGTPSGITSTTVVRKNSATGQIIKTWNTPDYANTYYNFDRVTNSEEGYGLEYDICITICREACGLNCCKTKCYKVTVDETGKIITVTDEAGNIVHQPEPGPVAPPTQENTQPAPLQTEPISLQIIPNPTTSVFRIVPDHAGEAAVEYKSVSIFDAAGKEVMQKTNISSATWIDITSLNPGIYMVKTTYKEKEVVLRVMRQDD